MKLTFTIDYRTHWGENISVEIESERIGRGKSITLLPLNTENGETWTGQFTIPARDMKQFLYRYVVVKEGQVIRREWDTVPRNFPANDSMSYIFPDYWRDIPALSHLYSSAYIRSMSPFNPRPTSFVYYRRTIVFRVQAPQLGTGQVLALVGNLEQISWTCSTQDGQIRQRTLTAQEASDRWTDGVSIKEFAATPADFQRLTELLG